MSTTTTSAGQPTASAETLRLAGVIAEKIEDGTLFNNGILSRRELADVVRRVIAVASAPDPLAFAGLPLATSPLSLDERANWISALDPLLKYAGSPGDWGYRSKLGLLTQRLLQVRQEITLPTS